jgi:riboflavin kinase / FMN adenylyltransferase
MKVARSVQELDPQARAVAIGTFDGVHRGHRRVLDTARETGMPTTVVTFDPHPRTALGSRIELLTTLERRLELLAEAGVQETLVVDFTLELARLSPEEFADSVLRPMGTELVVAGEGFRFGRGRSGDLALLERLGFAVSRAELLEGVSSSQIRRLLSAGEIEEAAALLGRPGEVDGVVVSGYARGGTLGFPTANVLPQPDLLVPGNGIYAGWAADHRAAISIGTNPHYGGLERRVEAFLLDFDGDLYGRRLVMQLWRRLRDEQAFESEQALIEQIARDVEETRAATPPI